MAVPDGSTIPYGYEIFELLGAYTEGYFLIHPVVNKIGTQYYVKRHDADTDINGDSKSDLNFAVLSTGYSEWTFNLNPELLEPYIERVGYVGGLTQEAYTAHKDVLDKVKNGTATYPEMLEVQGIVYNDANIVSYTPGYYRLHNQPGVSGISPVRYASGYLHDLEKTAGAGSTPIPMHFYSKQGTSTTFGSSGLKSGYTSTNATRGEIPISPTEYDPSTIFYINGGVNPSDPTDTHNPRVKMSTQGLYVKGNAENDDSGDAVMTATAGEATTFSLMDIGGAVFLIHDGTIPANRKYFHFSQSYTVSGDNKIYDLKYFHNSPTDDAKWCLQPANNQGLQVTTNNGGDDYFYTTFCAPYDVLLPNDADGKTYKAYTCKTWRSEGVNPVPVPAYSTYTEGKFVPAGTPVIIRTNDNSGSIQLTLPSTSPTTPLDCIFTGKYLEQMLAADASHDVYTLGLPFTTIVTIDRSTGAITAELPEKANSGVGFYINATPNKQAAESQSLWLRNNNYVLHNKIYYRSGSSGSSARELDDSEAPQFVPLIFDFQDNEELQPDGNRLLVKGDNRVYDLSGRCVANEQQVMDGSWWSQASRGVYILNGRKIIKK